jgi:hypothetical protein
MVKHISNNDVTFPVNLRKKTQSQNPFETNVKRYFMKNVIRIFVIALVGLTLASNVTAQVSATANASVTIISPLTISKVDDMNFGNVAIVSNAAGSVTLTTTSTRTWLGGAAGVATTAGVIKAAKFNIGGADGYVVSITLPVSCTVTSSGNNMTVDNFVSNPASGFTFITGNPALLYVGATVHTAAGGQPVGLYTTATPFTVTLSYN